LSENVFLKDAVSQWGNVGALVSALYTEDYELFGRSLIDKIAEPVRSQLIPYFAELKEIALNNGALGFGISGSGPSVFAMCKGDNNASTVKEAIELFYKEKGIDFNIYSSKINTQGIKII
jgi:homoserine kinase